MTPERTADRERARREGRAPDEAPRVGRPPRITRDDIAAAVLELGLGRSSMKAVAEHLGISVPGLYHHVRNRRELLELAAERSLSRVQLPEDRGQHWSEWLREWARWSRAALVEEPELFHQYVTSALTSEQTVEVLDSVIRVLARQGFTPRQAVAAFDAVAHCALGSVAEALRHRAAMEAGRPLGVEVRRILAQKGPDELPGVRAVVGGAGHGSSPGGLERTNAELEAEFEEGLTSLLVGIAVRRGEEWKAVLPQGR